MGLLHAEELLHRLGGLRFGHPVYLFRSIGSTNDEALAWATEGAKDFSLVIADEQTAGRGRMGRKWHTPPGSALALSLIIRPQGQECETVGLFSGLGALALVDALRSLGIMTEIKWPNDVLIQGRKVAGILAEAQWAGDRLDAVVLGIGINVAPEAPTLAEQHEGLLNFPATSVSENLGRPVDPVELLQAVLTELVAWRPRVASQDFITAWESNLAFRGETVQIAFSESAGKDDLPSRLENRPPALQEGRIVGLELGHLRL